MLRMLQKDWKEKLEFGFKKGCGTREAIRDVQMLCEKVQDNVKEASICFVGYDRAFDIENWVKMIDTKKQPGVYSQDRLTWELYTKQQEVVRAAHECTNTCSNGRGVRKGCSLSLLLFSI